MLVRVENRKGEENEKTPTLPALVQPGAKLDTSADAPSADRIHPIQKIAANVNPNLQSTLPLIPECVFILLSSQ